MENNIQQPLHTSQSSPHFSKTFIIILVIVFILTVGVGGYILGANQNQIAQNQPQPTAITQPSPIPTVDPTAGWETYTNTKYGYSLKYPKDMEVIMCSEENVYPVMKDRHFDPCQSGAGDTAFSISIRDEDITLKLADWYYRDYNISKSAVTLDGRQATKFTGSRSSDSPAPIPPTIGIITMSHKGKTLFINGIGDSEQAILSTFKFTDQ